jgi:iron complex transport system permease protein
MWRRALTSTAETVAAPARPARPGWPWLALGAGSILVAGVLGLVLGPVEIPAQGVMAALLDALPFVDVEHGLSQVEHQVLFEIRLPRVVLGALVGSALATSGAAYQGVFRNALADPYLLGVAAGGGLGATLALVSGASRQLVVPCALAGALSAVVVTYVLGRSAGGRGTTSLVLAGVAVGAFLTAVQTYVLQRNVEVLRVVYSWILGRLTTVGWGEVGLMVPYVLLAGTVLLLSRRLLDVMSVGDDEARSLGLEVHRVRALVVVAATLATAAAVSVSGLIGFVGIIVPHAVRLTRGWSYRTIIPLSMLFGAAFLVIADLAARTVVAPAEIPIGVVTAFLGAPFFVIVLRRAER